MRLKRAAVWLMVSVGLLVPAVLAGVRTRPARDEIRKQVEVLIARELGLEAELGDIDLEYLPPAAIVRRVRLTHPTEGLLVRAAHVRVTPRLWALANGRLELDEVTVEAAAVRLVVREGRLVNGPTLPRGGARAPGDEPPFRELTFSDTSVTVESDQLASGQVHGLDVDVSAEPGNVLEARLRAVGGLVRHARGVEPIRALEVRAALTPDALVIRRVDLGIGDARLKVDEGRVARKGPLDATLTATAAAPLAVAERIGLTAPVLRGDAKVTARVALRGELWSAQGRLLLSELRIDEFKVADAIDLPFRADPSGVDVATGVVRAASGEARIPSAHLAFDESLTLDADVTLHDLQFAEILENETLPNSHCEFRVTGGGGHFHGTLNPYQIDSAGDILVIGRDVRATLEGWHADPRHDVFLIPAAELRTRVRFDPTGVRFRQTRIAFGRSSLRVEAHLRLDDTFEVHGQSEAFDLGDFSPLATFDIGGRGSFRFDINGHFEDPTITGHARMAAFRFNTFVFGDVEGDLRFADLRLAITNARGERGRSQYAVPAGELDFNPQTIAAKASVQSERLVLSEFYEIWHIDTDPDFTAIQGEANGSAEIRFGSGILDVGYDASLARITAHGERFSSGALRGSWHWVDREEGWRGGDIVLDELTLRKGAGTVSIDGATHRGGVLDLFVVADRIALGDVQSLPPALSGIRSVLAFHFPVRGPLDALEIDDGRADLGEIRLGQARLGPSSARFSVRGPAVAVRADLFGGQIGLEANARRAPGIPYAARVDLRNIGLGWLLGRLGVPEAAGADAVADGVLHVTRGMLARPEASEGRLTLSHLRMAVAEYGLENVGGPIRLAFGGGAIEVEQADLAGRSTRISLSGTARPGGALALRMRGEVDLEFLQSLYPDLEEVRGTLTIDGHLAGTTRRPLLHGSASVRNGVVKLADYADRLEGISGEVAFSQTRLLFEGFGARFGAGRVSMRGSVRLDGTDLGAYALEFGLSDTAVRLDDEGTSAVLDGTAQLHWVRGERLPTIEGDLEVLRLRYEREIRLADLRQLGRRAQRAEVEEYDPARDHVALALRLHGRDNLVVQNNLLDAEFRIDEASGPLRVVGTDQRFGLVGELALTRGTLRFRSYDFDISRGAITFDDRRKIDPRFDITAETELRDWRVRIQALGTSESFRVFTSSEPELPEEDIAVLLAFGVTRDELSDPEANTGQVFGQGAIEALAAVTGVDREVRRVVPIDDIRIGSTYSTQSNRTEPTLSIGKRLTNDVRVTATTGLGESRDVSANVEWRLNRNLSVEGAYDNNNQQSTLGNVGVDLRFRLEFE
ncbi:MAG: translocation/assembly module TamB domain-containing protein [Deltaproteobacteria bacterium]|nr:translocation/assembly module TamB domain-containing protein [Deltaproteobacteria bacterium]